MPIIFLGILVVFAGLISITFLYPKDLRGGSWKYAYWLVKMIRVFLCSLCLLPMAFIALLSGGICEEITGDNYGPLATATSPNGQWKATIEGEFCHGLTAGSDTSAEYTVSVNNQSALKRFETTIKFGDDVQRLDLSWQDDHTLVIQGLSRPTESHGEIRVLYLDRRLNDQKKISTIKLRQE